MKQQTIILAGAAVAVGAFLWSRRGGATSSADAARLAGMRNLYANNAGQAAGVDAAIRQQWASMDSLFGSQPDFYI